MTFLKMLSSAALAVALVGCSSAQDDNAVKTNELTVNGSVVYRDRMALPDNAQITVTLSDVSLADAPAKVLSSVTFPAEGKQVPFMFRLPYTAEQVSVADRIALAATISVDGKLFYTTTTMYEVLTHGQPSQMDVIVERVQY